MNYIHYCADTRGRLYRDNISETYSADLENFRGNQARDIRDVSDVASYNPDPRQSPDRFGIVAAREGEDQWHFWGDRGPLGEYDSRHCETQAAGCWKLFFIGDYVLALKPVANLKPDDWTGAASTAAPAAGAPPQAPAAAMPPAAGAAGATTAFPLPIPKRPTLAGRLEVHRRDGKPVGSQPDDNALAKLPADLGNNVVAISVCEMGGGQRQRGRGPVGRRDGTDVGLRYRL